MSARQSKIFYPVVNSPQSGGIDPRTWRFRTLCQMSHCLLATTALLLVLSPPETDAVDAAEPTLDAFHKAVATENYVEAKRTADALLPQSPPDQKLSISLTYGRVLLGLKQKEPARKYIALMKKQDLPGDGPRLLSVYSAWLAALDGKQEGALKMLEKILEQNVNSVSTAEAADVLAMLYMAQKDRDNAKRAVDFGLKFLEYTMLKTDYTQALLRGRLKSHIASPDAEKLYAAAEKLRQEKKFAQAGRMFNQVTQQYARSEWVHPAQFRTGQCLVGLGRRQQAIKHWGKFIDSQSAGPWRGQAHVALIDLVLETDGDLEAASQHSLTATTTLGQELEEEAQKSWEQASFDIHLRHGIVALIDSRFEAATQALQHAQQQAQKDKRRITGLDRLIQAAKKRTQLLPEEVRAGNPKTVVALSLGTVFNILGQFDTARKLFLVPLTRGGRRGSAPHRSFAALGLARATASLARRARSVASQPGSSPPTFAQAKALYQQSIKEYAAGSWHEETLRDLALLIERLAADTFVHQPRAAAEAEAKASGKPVPRPTDEQRRDQTLQLFTARAQALFSWAKLTKQFPNSRHVPQAYYHSGVLLSESEKPVAALTAFAQLARRFPDSPWTGDAQVRLLDVKLEQQFDLPGAAALATAAIAWYEKLDHASAARARRGFAQDTAQGLRTVKQVGHDIFIRAGLVAYLQGHANQAAAYFGKAKPLVPPRSYEVVYGTVQTGLERLIEAAKTNKSFTPDEVRQGDEKARLILMLADVYYAGEHWEKSKDLCEKVIDDHQRSATREQRSWAYFKRARSFYRLEEEPFRVQHALQGYLVAQRTAPKTSWADRCLFLAGNIHWNLGDKSDQHAKQQSADRAITLWSKLLARYPEGTHAAQAACYIGVAYHWSNRHEEAHSAFTDALKQFPGSQYDELIRDQLIELKK